MVNNTVRKMFFSMLAIAVLSGCATKAPERFFWPPPPNEPRFEWLSLIYSESDLPKSRVGTIVDRATQAGIRYAFQRPIDVASDGHGLIYVSDNTARKVHVLDMNKGSIEPLGVEGAIREPLGLAVDAERRVYVIDAARNVVLVYSAEQKPLFSFGGNEHFEKPAFVAVSDTADRVYVTDVKGGKVVVFGKSGDYLFSFGEPGSDDGQLFSPQGIAINQEGKVFVVDMFNFRIQVFDPDGSFLSKFGEQGIHPSQFELPKDIAIDSDGHIHVTDARKSAVLSFQEDGRFLMATGMGRSAHAMAFTMPSGICIDKNDQMFITDNLLRRVSRWQYLSQAYLAKNPIDPDLLEHQRVRVEQIQKEKGL